MASVAQAEAQTEAAYTGAIRALATALDARDPYTAGHSERVSVLSVAIGRTLSLSADDLEVLRLGALLHDIGKIGVPDDVLRKPGALTDAEFDVDQAASGARRAHPAVGPVSRAAHPDRRAAPRAARRPRLPERAARRRHPAGRAHRARGRRVRRDDQRARLSRRAPLRATRCASCGAAPAPSFTPRSSARWRPRCRASRRTPDMWCSNVSERRRSNRGAAKTRRDRCVVLCVLLAVFAFLSLSGPRRRRRRSRSRASRSRASSRPTSSPARTRRDRPQIVVDVSPACGWATTGRSTCARGSACRGRTRRPAPVPPWDKELYQAGLRYERRGPVATRVDVGHILSPIGLGIYDVRPGLNPTIVPHLSYLTPMPVFDPTGPRVSAVSATYPLGAQLSLSTGSGTRARPSSTRRRRASTPSARSPTRGRRRSSSGGGVTPITGLRLGASFAHGLYATPEEITVPASQGRAMTMAGGEGRVGVRRHEDQRRDPADRVRNRGRHVGGVRMVRAGTADAVAALVRRRAARRHVGAAAHQRHRHRIAHRPRRVRSDRRLPRHAGRHAPQQLLRAPLLRRGRLDQPGRRLGRWWAFACAGGNRSQCYRLLHFRPRIRTRVPRHRADPRNLRAAPRRARHRSHVGAALAVCAGRRRGAGGAGAGDRHRRRADRQPALRRRGDGAAGGAVLRGLRPPRHDRGGADPRRARRSRRRRHPAARVRRRRARRRPVGRARQLHLGLDLQHLSRVRSPGAGRHRPAIARDTRARRARCGCRCTAGFEPMAAVTRDIPFIARRSTRDPADTRRMLGLTGDRPVVLRVVRRLRRRPAARRAAPDRALHAARTGARSARRAARIRISSPRPTSSSASRGYGIVSECVANDTALLYTSRGRFIEYDLFVAEMPRVLRCRYISQEDLLAGRWADAIDALIAQPAPPERPAVNGADVAARESCRWLANRGQSRKITVRPAHPHPTILERPRAGSRFRSRFASSLRRLPRSCRSRPMRRASRGRSRPRARRPPTCARWIRSSTR